MQRLLPLIAIVFAIALFFLYIRPTYSGPVQETRQKIASYDAALVAADRFSEKQAELTQARAQISEESLARLNDFLPDGVDNVQLILDLDALDSGEMRMDGEEKVFEVQKQNRTLYH